MNDITGLDKHIKDKNLCTANGLNGTGNIKIKEELFKSVGDKGDFEKKNIDKCIRYFMYRGYGFSDIKNCIDNIKEEYGE